MNRSSAPLCLHCGLPVEPPPPDGAPAFCCVGCEAVYTALHEEGLDAFYDLKRLSSEPQGGLPQASAENGLGVLDTDDFLNEHSMLMEDGSRCIDLYLDGVHCAGCVWLVEQLPGAMEGISSARLDLPRARLTLQWWPEERKLADVGDWLARFGYSARPVQARRSRERSKAEQQLLLQMGTCWALAGNVMLMAVALYAGLGTEGEDAGIAHTMRWLSLALSGLSVLVGGRTFILRAWASLAAAWRAGVKQAPALSMDVPIALGILVGWSHSAWATATGAGEIWFDSIAVLIAALLTARWLQMRGRRLAGDAADRLLAMLPGTARRIRGESVEVVPAESLVMGDRVEIRDDEVVPADGVVVEGRSLVEQGILTGESRPEPIGVGDLLHAGATNVGAPLQLEVKAVGESTRVGQLLAWIDDHDRRRAPVAQLADRLSGAFVATVLVLAVVAALLWWWLDPTMAVPVVVALLVVSCPCALGMATPLALAVAQGRAARQGLFIKHEDVLERLLKTTHVVFDKTGTLTEGRMSLLDVHGSREALEQAALLEAHSVHPVAAALRQWARGALEQAADDAVGEVQEVPGAGVEGVVNGSVVRVGRPSWVAAQSTDVALEDWDALTEREAERGRTPIAVSIDGRLEAIAGLGDPLRPEARALIEVLKGQGVIPVLLSGDHPRVVEATGRQLGLGPEEILGGVSPEEKRAFIEGLQSGPERVIAMVGDGVNDAGALIAADVGIAVQGGAEASLVAADIFMTRPGVAPLLELMEGAQDTMRAVRRNLAMSAVYNALGIGLAMAGLVGPLLAAIAMPISSLLVVTSSLLQRSFKKPAQPAPAPGKSMDAVPSRTLASV
ncbi:MAG: copper-translocating P-type ATPase [Myxococcales bacterium]|nr:copper-translocating P-type ATPase [Myxococcales bacterium]